MCCFGNRNSDYERIHSDSDKPNKNKLTCIYLSVLFGIYCGFSIPNIIGIYTGITYKNVTCIGEEDLAIAIISSSIINVVVTAGLFILFGVVILKIMYDKNFIEPKKWCTMTIGRLFLTIFYLTYSLVLIIYLTVALRHAFAECNESFYKWKILYQMSIINICYSIVIMCIIFTTITTNIFYGCTFICICCCMGLREIISMFKKN